MFNLPDQESIHAAILSIKLLTYQRNKDSNVRDYAKYFYSELIEKSREALQNRLLNEESISNAKETSETKHSKKKRKKNKSKQNKNNLQQNFKQERNLIEEDKIDKQTKELKTKKNKNDSNSNNKKIKINSEPNLNIQIQSVDEIIQFSSKIKEKYEENEMIELHNL